MMGNTGLNELIITLTTPYEIKLAKTNNHQSSSHERGKYHYHK